MCKTVIRLAIAGMLAMLAFAGTANAATHNFHHPMYNGNRLDWCYNWGVGCGQQAADAFCVTQGYTSAQSFNEANDIGASHPTRLIGTGAVCDQAFCDGFNNIQCYKPSAATFNNPMYNGNRLDWCVNWGTGCGQQAADKFCQAQGLTHATDFAEANDIGASHPTRLIGTGAVCDQGFCDGFTHITCE